MAKNQKPAGPLIAWTEDFAVGHGVLDGEHLALVDSINAIHAAECAQMTFDQLRPLLDLLIGQTVKHFQHENSILRNIGKRPLPEVNTLAFIGFVTRAAIEEHALGHGPSLVKLKSIVQSKSSSNADIGSALKNWFIDHAIKYDGHLKPVFAALRKAQYA